MAGVTDTQQHSGHQQHPGPPLTGRGGWPTDETLGVCIVSVWWGGGGGLSMHSPNLHMNIKQRWGLAKMWAGLMVSNGQKKIWHSSIHLPRSFLQ